MQCDTHVAHTLLYFFCFDSNVVYNKCRFYNKNNVFYMFLITIVV